MNNSLINKFIDKVKNDGKARFFVIIICCFLLVAIIGFNLFSNKTEETVSGDSVTEYVNNLESKLESLLNEVDGAGKVTVAISVESGMETVLAMSTTTKETSNGREIVSSPVVVNGKTVVLKENYPPISGVLIVAEGAKNLRVYNKILQATASLLNVKPSRIEILAMK